MTPPPLRLFLQILLPFAFGYFLSYLFRVVNAVIAPGLVSDLGLDPARLGLLTAAYFLSFAAFQLPLGLLLDRFGPRRVEAALLLVAAAGALLFAHADSLAGLVAGRALIGLGVSACLMAAFKAFVLWFPAHRLPFINGLQMMAGGLGAISATAPVAWLLGFLSWRQVFDLLALLCLAAAAVIFALVPERPAEPGSATPGSSRGGFRQIFSSRFFWYIAPLTIASQAAYLSIQGLWAGPWLRNVVRLDQPAAAQILLLMAVSMVAGFFALGTLAERLGRRNISIPQVAAAGMFVFILSQLFILLPANQERTWLWALFGFFGTAGILPYAALSQHFGAQLSGRANTALNLLVFVAAFAAQWGIGSLINLFGGADPAATASSYRLAFGLILLIQLAAFCGLVLCNKWQKQPGPSA